VFYLDGIDHSAERSEPGPAWQSTRRAGPSSQLTHLAPVERTHLSQGWRGSLARHFGPTRRIRSKNGSSAACSSFAHKLRIAAPTALAQRENMGTGRDIKSPITSLRWRRIRFAGLVVVAVWCAAIGVASFAERNEGWLPWWFILFPALAILIVYGLLAYVIAPLVVDLIRRIPP